MYLGAIILLPEGFDEHPEAHYPLMVYQGHFDREFDTLVGFREEPPDPRRNSENAKRPGVWGEYFRVFDNSSHQFYKDWTGPNFPRMILVTLQHANPYFDDSYAVNSANVGPYGDAITYELIPAIEKKYRGIGEGWARTLYGGSTGGWESLAVQIFYPDEYNGTWTFCPDPIDFRAYTSVNIYESKNAYYMDGRWKRTPRPGFRNEIGELLSTCEEMNHWNSFWGRTPVRAISTISGRRFSARWATTVIRNRSGTSEPVLSTGRRRLLARALRPSIYPGTELEHDRP